MDRARRRPVISSGGTQRRHRPDYLLLVISTIMLVMGLIVVFSISPALGAQKNVGENYFVNKQIIAVLLGIGAFILASNIPPKAWRKLEMPLLIAAGIASVAVRIFGERVNGAYRWIQIGGFSFQAAELIKFALIVWLAGFLSDRIRNGNLGNYQDTLKPLLIALVVIGGVVGVLQSDLGSAAVMVAIMGAMAYVAGLPMKKILTVGGIVAVGVLLLISTSGYRRSRLATFLNPARDCQGAGYQSCQALITVGSGGIIGLGVGRSVQAYGYLPEAANDSIFAIYGEKFGFIGCTILLALFIALFTRLKNIIEQSPDDYSRLLVVGILAWLSTQTFINIGAMLGLLPLKGITLPFISYGGTSLIFVTGAIGLAFSVSRYTTYGVITPGKEGKDNDSPTRRRGDRGPYHTSVSRRP